MSEEVIEGEQPIDCSQNEEQPINCSQTETEEETHNLYDKSQEVKEQEEVKKEEEEYIDFNDENCNFAFKDTFKNSKISKSEFESLKSTLEQMASPEAFFNDMTKQYGDEALNVVENYQNLTNDIFTEEEKEQLNQLPSTYKMLMVKMGKALGERYDRIKSDYGVTKETMATPEIAKSNASDRFKVLTKQLQDGRLTAEEYNRIKQERLELANYL